MKKEEIIESFQRAINNRNKKICFFYLSLLELHLSDKYFTDSQRIRNLNLNLSNSYFRGKTFNFAELSDISHLFSKLPKNIIRFPESLSHFGSTPEDFFKKSSKLKINGDFIIIGLRSVGSFFAPAVASGLDSSFYITIRPKDSKDKTKIPLKDKYVIVDEGPGSGKTFDIIIEKIQKINPKAKIIIFYNRKLTENTRYLRKNQCLFVPSSLFPEREQIKFSKVKKINSFNLCRNTFSLKTYESPKFKIYSENKILIAKFLGYSEIGKYRLNILKNLKRYSPKIYSYKGDYLLYEFTKEKGNKLDLKEVHKYFETFSSLSNIEIISKKDFEIMAIQILKENNINEILLMKFRSSIKKVSKRSFEIITIDWKQEREKWIIGERPLKLDNFHCEDYGDLPAINKETMIVGFYFENNFDLEELDLNDDLKNLSLILYLIVKLNYYQYITNNLLYFSNNSKLIKKQVQRLKKTLDFIANQK